MQKELLRLRTQLSSALSMIDEMLTATPSKNTEEIDVLAYRVSPGGSLSELGIAEINKRLERGETDAVIARDMALSVPGVAKRRKIWKENR